jgi:enterochelin esterase family protein
MKRFSSALLRAMPLPTALRTSAAFYLALALAAPGFVLAQAQAQAQAQDTKAAATNTVAQRPRPAARGPLVSPEIGTDGSVTFRYNAPKATSVKVSGQFGPETALAKDAGGIWTVTLPKVKPGVHEYHFVVDGLSVIDAGNSWVKPQRWPNTSILHIPSNPPAPWDLQDIPHGTLHEHVYKSKALGGWRRIVVYTPPSTGKSTKLPVLYLSHGYSDNEASWTVHGKAHWILDSLIASGKAKPMIVVMPDAHALAPGSTPFDEYGPANSAALCSELVQDILPLVEASYPVNTKPSARAFAGLSMGGHHALTVALNHHERFNWIGAFSSAPPPNPSVSAGLDKPSAVNSDLKLFWVACGTKDFLYQRNKEFHAVLEGKGIKHQFVETEGDHSWPIWRNYLIEFTPKLFR